LNTFTTTTGQIYIRYSLQDSARKHLYAGGIQVLLLFVSRKQILCKVAGLTKPRAWECVPNGPKLKQVWLSKAQLYDDRTEGYSLRGEVPWI